MLNYIRIIWLAAVAIFSSLFGEGAQIGLIGFLIPSILMGIGVAIDVFISTVVQFRDEHLAWKTWTLPVTITHTLFPALGYFLFWYLETTLPIAQIFLGIVGFILVALFIYEVLSEAMGSTPVFGISNWLGNLFGFNQNDAQLLVAVLAVSWDALWSGPAKAAQAIAGNWSTQEVILSFALAGLVVAIVAELALFVAGILRKVEFKDIQSLAGFNIVGLYFELSVIGGFGVMSLWHAFAPQANLYYSISISAMLMFVLFLFNIKKLQTNQLSEAKTAVQE